MSDAAWVPQPVPLSRGLLAVLDRILAVLVVIGFSVMALVIVIQVLARYIANNPTVWSEELAISLFVWSTMLAIALGLRRGEHLTLDVVSRFLPAQAARWLALVLAIVTAAVMGFLGYLTLGLIPPADRQLLAGIAGGLGIPAKVSWVYLAVPVGAFFSVLFTIERAVAFFRGRLSTLSVDADQAVVDGIDDLLELDEQEPETPALLLAAEEAAEAAREEDPDRRDANDGDVAGTTKES